LIYLPVKKLSDKYKGPDIEDLKPELQRGDDYLMVVAIDEYEHCPKLSNCVKDAKGFITVMQKQYKLSKDNTFTLFNEEATRSNVIRTLKELRPKIGKKDSLIIYFSGHGEVEDDQGYWVPVDGKPKEEWDYISATQIKTQLNAIDSFHTLVIADACFAGSFFISYKATELYLSNRRSRLGISASHSRERALDGNPGENSPFATELLRVLKNNQDALPVDRLFTMVRDRVAKTTRGRQTPIFKHLDLKGDDQGQYVFLPTTNETIAWAKAKATHTIPAYLEFCTNFPKGKQVKEAKAAIALLEDEHHWKEAEERDTISAYLEYQKRHPQGQFIQEANKAIQQLSSKEAISFGATKQTKSTSPPPPKREKPSIAKPSSRFKKLIIPGAVLLGVLVIGLIWLLPSLNKNKLTKRVAVLDEQLDKAIADNEKLLVTSIRTDYTELGLSVDDTLISKQLVRIDHWIDSIDRTDAFISQYSSGILPELVEVKGGNFMMGCKEEDHDHSNCSPDQVPAHNVSLAPFFIGKFEITNSQFVSFLNAKGISTILEKGWYDHSLDSAIELVNDQFKILEGFEDHPAKSVSWNGANAYCAWLNSNLPKVSYRLPTEAEWEYAARGGHLMQKGIRHLYAGSSAIDSVGWYKDNSKKSSHPVGEKLPNELGIYDMSGNVQEWCGDWYDENYYTEDNKSNPKGPNTGILKVVRGGASYYPQEAAEVISRHKERPNARQIDIGFRIVKEASQ
jgi:formylglycine-generating enzyme required for sulfatase activity